LITIDASAASIARGLFPSFGIPSLSVEPRIFMFRKRAAPTIGKIEDRAVKPEHGIVTARLWSTNPAHSAPETVFALFGFHFR
jgi:hypothetical protein